MDSIKPSVDKLDLLDRLCDRADKESLKALLKDIRSDIQLLDVLLLGLKSMSTAPDYRELYSSTTSTSITGFRNWTITIETSISEIGLTLLNEKVNHRYPLKTDK